jgi:hypothetical protein
MRENMRLQPGTNSIEILVTDRRNRRYYRNFLLKTREEARNDYFTYETRRVAATPAQPVARAPEVILAQPDGPVVIGAKERSKRVTVKGTVSSASPLATLRIGAKEIRATDFETEVVVTPADKNILVEAVDQAGNRTAVSIPVSQAPAAPQVKIEGSRYALVIGISDYGPKGPANLHGSADAKDFAGALTGPAGFRQEDVMVLTDAAATHDQIRNALRGFVARPGPDDLLIVFFAGFGLHDPKDPSNLYLAAYGTDFARVPETAVSVEELKAALKANVRARQALFLFDVNHQAGPNLAAPNNNLINNYLLRMFPDDAGKTVMVGSSVSENSIERNGHGLFARGLIEAARGSADANQDGAVSMREWVLAVSRAVRTESQGAQTPRFTLAPAERPLFAAAK